MFYPGSDHFLIPDPNPTIFSSRIRHEKRNANLRYFFLAACDIRTKVLILVIVKKTRDPEKIHHGWIPDPGVKKHRIPDPQRYSGPDLILVNLQYSTGMDLKQILRIQIRSSGKKMKNNYIFPLLLGQIAL
jgi:hypothetical protein